MTQTANRRFVGVSLKMHLDDAATRSWLTRVAATIVPPSEVEVVVLPSFTAIASARSILAGSHVSYGAQDCSWEESGAFTGEVSAAVLRELGCGHVEVGHAERRRLFHEDDQMIARKAAAASANSLVPIVCTGELVRSSPRDAAEFSIAQLQPVIRALATVRPAVSELVVAYEPVWAIGAPEAAPAWHINEVAAIIRRYLDRAAVNTRVIYGGSAGPGLFAQLHDLDGLFLGRSALDVDRFAATLAEVGL
ncbi:MAG: triose-phosphate isomerase [Actinomycetota bacterium]|nr:triose-phosphate isomerase [Actinomycetota bacterium]